MGVEVGVNDCVGNGNGNGNSSGSGNGDANGNGDAEDSSPEARSALPMIATPMFSTFPNINTPAYRPALGVTGARLNAGLGETPKRQGLRKDLTAPIGVATNARGRVTAWRAICHAP